MHVYYRLFIKNQTSHDPLCQYQTIKLHNIRILHEAFHICIVFSLFPITNQLLFIVNISELISPSLQIPRSRSCQFLRSIELIWFILLTKTFWSVKRVKFTMCTRFQFIFGVQFRAFLALMSNTLMFLELPPPRITLQSIWQPASNSTSVLTTLTICQVIRLVILTLRSDDIVITLDLFIKKLHSIPFQWPVFIRDFCSRESDWSIFHTLMIRYGLLVTWFLNDPPQVTKCQLVCMIQASQYRPGCCFSASWMLLLFRLQNRKSPSLLISNAQLSCSKSQLVNNPSNYSITLSCSITSQFVSLFLRRSRSYTIFVRFVQRHGSQTKRRSLLIRYMFFGIPPSFIFYEIGAILLLNSLHRKIQSSVSILLGYWEYLNTGVQREY